MNASYTHRKIARPVILCLLQAGCSLMVAPPQPSVAFDKIPAYSEGGPGKLEEITGRATGAQSGQRIVIYARSGL